MPWLISTAVLLAVIIVVSVGLYLVTRERDRAYRFGDAAVQLLRERERVLESIRDSGPTGPDPLPPCRWCGQGPGHWGGRYGVDAPAHSDCPAVIAWYALRPKL